MNTTTAAATITVGTFSLDTRTTAQEKRWMRFLSMRLAGECVVEESHLEVAGEFTVAGGNTAAMERRVNEFRADFYMRG
jgi:hypothetical protein